MSITFSENLLQGKLLFPFIAPPNGGKGTQTQLLSERYYLPTFDMGATFRSILKEGHDPVLKAELDAYMGKGKLVPTNTVIKIFKKNFESLATKNPEAKGFIIDGFPRNAEQANDFFVLSQSWGASIVKVIYLNVGMNIVKSRAIGRRFCSLNSRHVYNINDATLTPTKFKLNPDGTVYNDAQGNPIWLCNLDDAELVLRPDDLPQTVEKRLKEYSQETDPLIHFFRTQGKLFEVDGDQPPEKVTQAIESFIQPVLGLLPKI